MAVRDPGDTLNPYAAPAGRVEDVRPEGATPPTARRLSRLAASIIDNLLYLCFGLIPLFYFWPDYESSAFLATVYLFCAPMLIVQLYFLRRDGQTLGKKALGIRIVRTDGNLSSLGRLILLRMIPPTLVGFIPIAGPFLGMANVLFIFGPARRCLHDYIADTVVVEAA